MQISKESTSVAVFFNNVAGLQNSNFIKKWLQRRFFSVKLAKFLRALCFRAHLQWLLLTVSGFQSPTPKKMSLCEFSKIFKNICWQSISWRPILVFICEIWEIFQNTSFIEHLWKTAYFMYKLQNFNHQPPDTVKNCVFTNVFQVFYTRTRSNHSKALIYLKLLKIIC